MKRHSALQDFSRDHMFALRVAHHIDQAVRRITNGPSVEEAVGELVATWSEDLSLHLREEEDVLLPLISRHLNPTDLPEVRRILDDHAWFRDALPRLIATDAADLDPAWVGEIGTRLHDHVRHEERVLYPLIENLLTDAELDELAAASKAFRLHWRSADRVGPFRSKG